MAAYEDDFDGMSRSRVAAIFLYVLAIGIAAVTMVFVFVQVAQISSTGAVPAGASIDGASSAESQPNLTLVYMSLFLRALFGLGAAALLFGLAELLRRIEDLPATIRDVPQRAGYGMGAVSFGAQSSETDDVPQASVTELAVLLRELRDISLLNPEERALRQKGLAAEAVRELEKSVPELLRSHNWVEARRRVQLARERYPAQPIWDQLDARIEKVRTGVENQDIEAAKRQVNDLAALGAWERAFDVVHDLLQRHPDSDAARQLAQFVQNERGKADAAQRARLMSQVQEAVKRRDWNTALSAANALMRQYGESNEARALRLDLPTLAANAEIQTRKRIEQEITRLTHAKRYQEAIQLARNLIERYPKSPQAAVLREKLPDLEDRARSFAML